MANDASATGRIVIAGGSGFVGVSLATHLAAAGHSIVLLSRQPPKLNGPWKHVFWDARTLGEWRQELDGADGLVNLAGRSVDCIKSPNLRTKSFVRDWKQLECLDKHCVQSNCRHRSGSK